MSEADLRWVTDFIWRIADDVLRDVVKRGKYSDVILPMTVIRRMDAVLEPSKENVLKMKERLDAAGIVDQHAALCHAAGQAFYNTSKFTLRDLKARARQQQLKIDFEAYLDGFSKNVQEIIDKFDLRAKVPILVNADILGGLIEKFLDSSINLSPQPVLDGNGQVKLPGLDNHGMGTIFEELIRRFNEENNEEAGEHFTPRDVIKLMADLIFIPIANQIESSTYLVYDGACGTGGMLTVSEERLVELAREHGKEVSIHLYGQETQPETYAMAKADLLLKGDGSEAENIAYGSTLSADGFSGHEFDFMLSNPPYGKSWKIDLDKMGGKDGISDSRFIVNYQDNPEYRLITRTSDGQLLFLVNMLSKMKHDSKLGSRIAEVHNGSSLFTGEAGQGESNIRRWIVENDLVEAIIALPLNIFYNTGIATYIWVLSSRKEERRRGKIQLIDASSWFESLRKNLGSKNCVLSDEDRKRVVETYLRFEETENSKILPTETFGYWRVRIERPLRLPGIDPDRAYKPSEIKALMEGNNSSVDVPTFPVIRKILRLGDTQPDSKHGLFLKMIKGQEMVVEYEPNPELRDSEQVPLTEEGGLESFFEREVLPFAPDAWIDEETIEIGYEISFTRYFYKPPPLRSLEEIRTDITTVARETDGLVDRILEG